MLRYPRFRQWDFGLASLTSDMSPSVLEYFPAFSLNEVFQTHPVLFRPGISLRMLVPFNWEYCLETRIWALGVLTDARCGCARSISGGLIGKIHTHTCAHTQRHLDLSLNLLDLSGYVQLYEFTPIASIPTQCQIIHSMAPLFRNYTFPLWWWQMRLPWPQLPCV